MNQDALNAIFDRQAAHYDSQQQKLAAVHAGLHFQLEWLLGDLPDDANILCVGLGTGAELIYLAQRFPRWQFTAVEPAGEMLAICQQRATEEGVAQRCHFHHGYVETLPELPSHHAATCFLVSQFILDDAARSAFFAAIAARLTEQGRLVSADLSAELGTHNYDTLLAAWVRMLHGGKPPAGALEALDDAWRKNVAIRAPAQVSSIIASGGFTNPVQFYQGGLVHGWLAERL